MNPGLLVSKDAGLVLLQWKYNSGGGSSYWTIALFAHLLVRVSAPGCRKTPKRAAELSIPTTSLSHSPRGSGGLDTDVFRDIGQL